MARFLMFVIVIGAMVLVPYQCMRGAADAPDSYTYDKYAKPNAPAIRVALDDVLQAPDRACLQTVRFPFDSSVNAGPCDVCDKLVDAGLLDKAVSTAQQGDREVTAVRYELTASGRPLYTEALRQGSRDNIAGLCFGRTVVHEMKLWTAPAMSTPIVDVRYVARIENPHEILFGPHARALKLPQLTGTASSQPAVLPRETLCAWMDGQGKFSGTLEGPRSEVNGQPRC